MQASFEPLGFTAILEHERLRVLDMLRIGKK
jgi:hypothetical protein